jgi:hypothetical protein
MSNVSIRREKKYWGFYGHSTIKHGYNPKAIRGDKVVVDDATGLMWHQGGSDDWMKWDDAKEWVEDLNSEEGYAGYHDWRLPTLEEAASLLESNKRNDLYIDPVFSKKQRFIWTGDRYGSEAAWDVLFFNGSIGSGKYFSAVKSRIFYDGNGYVRPVRSMR